MTGRRKTVLLLTGLYALGLVWGQARLPLAAIKNMTDYPLLRREQTISQLPGALVMSHLQERYLRRSLPLQGGLQPPFVSAEVKWNWGLAARVKTHIFYSGQGAEWLDCAYVCLFGYWIPVFVISHAFA